MLHYYAAIYVHEKTEKKGYIYVESIDSMKPGDVMKQWNGDSIIIDFELPEKPSI